MEPVLTLSPGQVVAELVGEPCGHHTRLGPLASAGSVTTMITEHVTSALLELSEQTLERGSPRDG